MKTDLPAKAKEQVEGLKDPTKTEVYKSIFRHKHDDTPRIRSIHTGLRSWVRAGCSG